MQALRFTRLMENYAFNWSKNNYCTVNTRLVSGGITQGLTKENVLGFKPILQNVMAP